MLLVMFKKLWNFYKVPLLISLTLAIVLISIKVEKQVLGITLIVLGSLIGTFFLDLDYFIWAFFLEPASDFSKTLVGYTKHADFMNIVNHIYYHKNELQEKTLNSVFFQVVLAAMSVIVVSTTHYNLVKALILSIFANSIYRMFECYFEGRANEWFWALKKKPGRNGVILYGVVLVIVLMFSVKLF